MILPEALDIEQPGHLELYLQAKGYLTGNGNVTVSTLVGGVSNRTVLARFSDGRLWVVKQALEKLRVQVDWFCNPERIHREASGLRALYELAPPRSVVEFIFEDFDCHLLGMEAVPSPHENFKTRLMCLGPKSDFVAGFGTLLGTIQSRALQKRGTLMREFSDRSFFKSLRLDPYFAFTANQVPEAAPFLENLITASHAAASGDDATLVHGDFSPKNVLIYQDQLVLLDHEVIHWGDPSFDPGFALTHLLSKAHHFPTRRAAFAATAKTFWKAYVMARGGASPDLEARVVAQTLGLMLARVAGRSPLEYLDFSEKTRQKRVIVNLMAARLTMVGELTDKFIKGLA